jgi:ABC-2 type transport system ATP-binding protein
MIRVDNVWKKFGRHEALRGLSLSVPEGSAYALMGANGAGKTTTIRVLMNILSAERGTATVLGVDSRRISPGELAQIGYVSENQELPAGLTVADYLDYLRPFYPAWDNELESSLRQRLRLPADRKIGALSHGMRMKMALACALPFRPKLMILDEPFSGLDPLVREELMESLLEQAGEMTVLISSHELSEIEGMATHAGFIDEGRLLFEESMTGLSARFREVHVTLDREATPPGRIPEEWLDVRTSGNSLMFVDSGYSEEKLSSVIGSLNGAVRNVDTQPMGLRSIFTVLAKSRRK